jgi:hypothetical protein
MVKSPTRLVRPKSQSADVGEDVAVAAGEVAGEEEQVLQPVALLLVFKSSSRQLWELLWWRATRTWASKPVWPSRFYARRLVLKPFCWDSAVLTSIQMELRMKDICEGRKNKLEVVQESLDQYRDVYLRVQQKLPVLHAVSIVGWKMVIPITDCSQAVRKYVFGENVWRERTSYTSR